MAHRVAGGVERFKLDRFADFDNVARTEADVYARNLAFGIGVGEQLGASCRNDMFVTAGMIAMLVRIQHLGDGPALALGARQALFMIQGINSHCFPRLGASNEIVEVAVAVGGPDLFDNHGAASFSFEGTLPRAAWRVKPLLRELVFPTPLIGIGPPRHRCDIGNAVA